MWPGKCIIADHHWLISETPLEWRFAGGTIVAPRLYAKWRVCKNNCGEIYPVYLGGELTIYTVLMFFMEVSV